MREGRETAEGSCGGRRVQMLEVEEELSWVERKRRIIAFSHSACVCFRFLGIPTPLKAHSPTHLSALHTKVIKKQIIQRRRTNMDHNAADRKSLLQVEE